MAPEAQLLAMKVFSNNPDGNEYCYDDDVIAAIEDSVAHKADVINMSLGATAGFVDENNPEQIAIKMQRIMVLWLLFQQETQQFQRQTTDGMIRRQITWEQ